MKTTGIDATTAIRRTRAVIAAIAMCLCMSPARALELITNGGFETGDFTGWTVDVQPGGAGAFFAADNSVPPGGGLFALPFGPNPSVGPRSGNFYAVSDQTGASAQTLIQSFTVPGPGLLVNLSFALFVNDWSGAGPIVNPAGLDYTATPNQHARVDLLTSAATAFDTSAGVLSTFYLGVDAGPGPHDYTDYNFDLTPFVGAGGTFQLRFADVETEGFLNQGVDNVSITATPLVAAASEPTAILLVALGCVALSLALWRRRGA
jgi:hypothetical protein